MRHNTVRSPAYEEGRNAFLSGESQDSNPYGAEPDSSQSVDWLQGYSEAAADDQFNE